MYTKAIIAVAVLAVPLLPSAQGAGVGGGRIVVTNAATGTSLQFSNQGSLVGGLVPPGYHGSPGYPLFGVWGGYGGELSPYLYDFFDHSTYGLSNNYYTEPAPGSGNFNFIPSSTPQLALSNEFPATLHVELTKPGEVWINGKKYPGTSPTEWNFTSPLLRAGQEYKFDIEARWEANGKMQEYKRQIAVESGKRGSILVLAGSTNSDSLGNAAATAHK
jgi:uncharacterized protein (TIGR03000 family)